MQPLHRRTGTEGFALWTQSRQTQMPLAAPLHQAIAMLTSYKGGIEGPYLIRHVWCRLYVPLITSRLT